MTGKTQALQVLVYKSKFRILLNGLNVVHTLSLRIPSIALAPLTLMVIPFKNLQALLLPCAGLVELPFLDQPDYFFKSHTGAHLPLMYRCCCSGIWLDHLLQDYADSLGNLFRGLALAFGHDCDKLCLVIIGMVDAVVALVT